MSTAGDSYSSPLNDRYLQADINRAWSDHARTMLIIQLWVRNHNRLTANYPEKRLRNPLAIGFTATGEQTVHIGAHQQRVLLERVIKVAKDIEKTTGHDLVALLRAVKQVLLPTDYPVLLHTGLTSSDVQDQAVLSQTIWSINHLYDRVNRYLYTLTTRGIAGKYDRYLVGRTHLQPAEPTTLLHRMTMTVVELTDWLWTAENTLRRLLPYLGLMSGSVGTYGNLQVAKEVLSIEDDVPPYDVRPKTQTLPRYLDLYVAQMLDSLAACLHKIAFDFRLEASYGSVQDSEAPERVGSSAMPFKRNPIRAEKINSLTRHVHHLAASAWDTAAWQGLERTLDDSAGRRMWLPEAFLTITEAWAAAETMLNDLSRILERPPDKWRSIWMQARVQSWTEAREFVEHATDRPISYAPDIPNDLSLSIATDKDILKRILKHRNPPGKAFAHLNLGGPGQLVTLQGDRWDE